MYNTGSDVLGVLIARASGQPFEEFLGDRLFTPLGMKDTAFGVPVSKIDRLATSYDIDPQTGSLEVYDPAEEGQWSRPPAFPSGKDGLVSTFDDYLAFARMLMNDGQYGESRILSPASVELMTTNHLTPEQRQSSQPILESSQGWGFGVAVQTRRGEIPCTIGSYGWSGGMGTTWLNDPDEETVMILMTQVNWTSPNYPEVSQEFLTSAYRELRSSGGI
jgi:CubicO group peptidase (beta-lactamase class C family)